MFESGWGASPRPNPWGRVDVCDLLDTVTLVAATEHAPPVPAPRAPADEPGPVCRFEDGVLLACAELETEPGAAALLLDRLDVAGLTPAQQLRVAALWHRVEAQVAGRRLTAVAAFAGPEPDPDDLEAGITARRGEPDFTDCEVAVALRTSSVGGARAVALARTLAGRLPATQAALRAGRIGYVHALVLAELTGGLDDEQAGRAEELALVRAVDQSPTQLRASLRRIVSRIDPDALKRKERAARSRVRADVCHGDDGHGELHAGGPSNEIDLIDRWLDAYARAKKAAGDDRSLAALRFAGLVDGAEHYLTGCHGDRAAPTQHGRPITVNVTIDLPTFLGLTDHPGEVLGSGALIPAEVIRQLIPDAILRRIITDPLTGTLIDYGRSTYRVPPDLGAHITFRDVTAIGPGSTVPAGRTDFDHLPAWDAGGRTDRDGLACQNRRWHRAKTLGGFTVRQNPDRTWTWTTPTGLTATTHPHDYRLGP